jgi:hypothetical protein
MTSVCECPLTTLLNILLIGEPDYRYSIGDSTIASTALYRTSSAVGSGTVRVGRWRDRGPDLEPDVSKLLGYRFTVIYRRSDA